MFDGKTYEPKRDRGRLVAQMERISAIMADGAWHTLYEIERLTGDPVQSISARIRDLRKSKFGGYIVNRRRITDGTHEYQLGA